MARKPSKASVECHGCNRDLERTKQGWRRIKLNANGLCAACVDANAEAAATIKRGDFAYAPDGRRVRVIVPEGDAR